MRLLHCVLQRTQHGSKHRTVRGCAVEVIHITGLFGGIAQQSQHGMVLGMYGQYRSQNFEDLVDGERAVGHQLQQCKGYLALVGLRRNQRLHQAPCGIWPGGVQFAAHAFQRLLQSAFGEHACKKILH